MTSKIIFRIFPYFICAVAGITFFIVGKELNGDLKGLVHGIAGAFLSIPVLYLIYELSREFSEKKLNKELFDYAKMQIDREVLSITNQLSKVIQPYDKHDFSFKGISTFLSKNKNQIKELLESSEYLGFQVFKNWSVSERNIHAILENPFILQRLENDQSISIVSLLKEIRAFESVQKEVKKLYEVTSNKAEGYQIQGGKDINPSNIEYPNRT